jgi:hypothetical protein
MDVQTNMKNLTVAFQNFANAPNTRRHILINLEFSTDFPKILNTKFHENPFGESRFVPYGRTNMNKLTVAFKNFANAPNMRQTPMLSEKIQPTISAITRFETYRLRPPGHWDRPFIVLATCKQYPPTTSDQAPAIGHNYWQHRLPFSVHEGRMFYKSDHTALPTVSIDLQQITTNRIC